MTPSNTEPTAASSTPVPPPTAAKFLKEWIASTRPHTTELLRWWRDDYKEYTALVKGRVLESVAEALRLEYWTEYYSTDAIFYLAQDRVPGGPENQGWFRSLRVAFEHEHTYDKRLREEIGHHLILRAGLYVVVSYPPSDQRDSASPEHMGYFHDIIKPCPHSEELSKSGNFLLIFGYPNASSIDWHGWVYTTERWEKCDPASA